MYFFISSSWVKSTLKNKQLISFIQTSLLHKYAITYTHISMFTKNSTQLNLIGLGLYGINYTSISSKVSKIIKLNKSKIVPCTQFNTQNCLNKLNTLGFSLGSVMYSSNYYPLKSINLPENSTINSYKSLPTVTSIVVSLRSVFIKNTLLKIKQTT